MKEEKDPAEATGDAEEAMAAEAGAVVGMVEEEAVEEDTAGGVDTEAEEDMVATAAEIAIVATIEIGVPSRSKRGRKSMLR